jgi:hypothetical protein
LLLLVLAHRPVARWWWGQIASGLRLAGLLKVACKLVEFLGDRPALRLSGVLRFTGELIGRAPSALNVAARQRLAQGPRR